MLESKKIITKQELFTTLQPMCSFHNVHPPNREGSNRLGARGGRSHPIIDSINISACMGIGLTRA